jgi:predicted secreted protein
LSGKAAIGTSIKYSTSGEAVGELKKIGGVSMTADFQDVTTHDSVGGFKEYIATLKEPGEVSLEGNMWPNDAGQIEILDHFEGGDEREMIITYPEGDTWTFNALISAFSYGEADAEGVLRFTATVRITGMPVFAPSGGS